MPIPNVIKKVDILQCYNGVLYKRKFFPDLSTLKSMIENCLKCKTVDDIVISKYLSSNGTKILSIPGTISNKSIHIQNTTTLAHHNTTTNAWMKCVKCLEKK